MSTRKPTISTTTSDLTPEPRPTNAAPAQERKQTSPEEKKQHLKKTRVDYAMQLQFNNPDKYAELQQRKSDRASDKAAKNAAKLERKAKGETVEQQSKEQLEKEKEQEEAADDEFLGIKTGSEEQS